MKHLIKAVTFVSFMLMVGVASAASLQDLQVRELDKKSAGKITHYNDAVAMNITYVGSSTQAIVFVSTGHFKTFVPGPVGTIDLNYDITAAGYDTMGELCDAIDADSEYGCKLVDVKRNDLSIKTQSKAINNSFNIQLSSGYNVLVDSGGVDTNGWVGGTQMINTLGITPESGKRVVLKYCRLLGTAADTAYVYGKLGKYTSATDNVTRDDTTEVWKFDLPTITTTTIGNQYDGNWMEFAKDAHVVVQTSDNDTAQDSTNYVECIWEEK